MIRSPRRLVGILAVLLLLAGAATLAVWLNMDSRSASSPPTAAVPPPTAADESAKRAEQEEAARQAAILRQQAEAARREVEAARAAAEMKRQESEEALRKSAEAAARAPAEAARRRAEEEARRAQEEARRVAPAAPPPMPMPPPPTAGERAERESGSRASAEAEAARRKAEEEARRALEEARRAAPAAPPPPMPPPSMPPPPAANGTTTVDTLPDFPWPPPRPSSRQEVDRALIVSGSAAPTLRKVADRLEDVLRRAHYEYSFYGVPGGGFALVARLERIEADGAAVAGDRRFLPPDAREPFDLSRYVSALFFAPAGYYRLIAFVVTDRAFTASEAPLDSAQARRLPSGGASALPAPFASRPFGPDYRVFALIYEYRKESNAGDAMAQVPGRLPALTHLLRSGLQPALESGR